MSVFSTSTPVGEIVSEMPGAGEIFKKYRIDFCCGGMKPLGEAILEQGADEREVLEKLDAAFAASKNLAGQTDFKAMSETELIRYIESTHHVYVKKTLPMLGEYTTTVLRAHGQNHGELFKVHKLFHGLKTELEQHLIKEEELLFPAIREYLGAPRKDLLEKIRSVMCETIGEHETAGGVLKELRKITGDYSTPADGCSTYRTTYEKMEELESDLFKHIHLENNILFKKF